MESDSNCENKNYVDENLLFNFKDNGAKNSCCNTQRN